MDSFRSWLYRLGGCQIITYAAVIVSCIATIALESGAAELINKYSLAAWKTVEGCTIDLKLSQEPYCALLAGCTAMLFITEVLWVNTFVVRSTINPVRQKYWSRGAIFWSVVAASGAVVACVVNYVATSSGDHQSGCTFNLTTDAGNDWYLGSAKCSYRAIACGFVDAERQHFFEQVNIFDCPLTNETFPIRSVDNAPLGWETKACTKAKSAETYTLLLLPMALFLVAGQIVQCVRLSKMPVQADEIPTSLNWENGPVDRFDFKLPEQEAGPLNISDIHPTLRGEYQSRHRSLEEPDRSVAAGSEGLVAGQPYAASM